MNSSCSILGRFWAFESHPGASAACNVFSMTSAIIRSHAPWNPYLKVGACLPDDLDLLWSQHNLAPGGFLSDMSSPRSCTLFPHSRVRPHQQIAYLAYARVDLPLCISGCPLSSPTGRPQSSSGGSVCLYRAGNHCLLATGLAPSTSV